MASSHDPSNVDRARLASALRAGMERANLNQSELAEAVGVTHPTVSDWVNEKKTPGRRNLQRLIETLDLEWSAIQERSESATSSARPSGGDGAAQIYPSDPSPPTTEVGPGFLSTQELRRLTNRPPASLQRLVVTGDSMSPDIRANDTVIYVPVAQIDDDGIYVVDIDGAPKVKRIQRYGGGALELIPSNDTYSKELFVPETSGSRTVYRSRVTGLVADITVVGKVVLHPRPL